LGFDGSFMGFLQPGQITAGSRLAITPSPQQRYSRVEAISRPTEHGLGKIRLLFAREQAHQCRGGLGSEAQREAAARYLSGSSWKLVAEYVETECQERSEARSRRQRRDARRLLAPRWCSLS
jgi:hypothetical protein